jgi:hypothetical protein
MMNKTKKTRKSIGTGGIVFCALISVFSVLAEPLAEPAGDRFVGATTTKPAQRWEGGFLTGNGTMGAIMFGEPYQETVVVNHHKLYLPRGNKEIVYDLASHRSELKKIGLAAGIKGPAEVHGKFRELTGHTLVHTDPFHPAFMLNLEMTLQSKRYENYAMTQNFTNGELRVAWSDEHGDWERKMFISRPGNVAVMQISGPKGKVGFTLGMEIEHERVEPEFRTADGSLSAHVVYVKGKGGYDNLLRIVPTGGTLTFKDGKAVIAAADSVLLMMQVDTWRTPLPKEQSEAWAFSPDHPDFGPGYKTNLLPDMRKHLASLPADYNRLLEPHAEIHGELFSRVKLDLNAGAERYASSEVLLTRAAEEEFASPASLELMYNACRYLMICSTGVRPSNLQGIWTGTWKPAWSGDYTTDSNIQLEIQSLLSCNMPDLMEPYFQLIESWMPDCRLNASKMYGFRGAMSGVRASNVNLQVHWGKFPGDMLMSALGWMAHFFYDYYLFTGDEVFLEQRAVPLMKETVLFYEDLLTGTEDANGKYRFYMSYSPEHKNYANATFDIGTARAMLRYLIASCEQLSIEAENIPKWKTMLEKMPPYLVNESGGLQEWSWPGAPENYNQRHHSHFVPLYQYNEFDRDLTPELWKANQVAFQKKLDGWMYVDRTGGRNMGAWITHGVMNVGQCSARLGRSEILYDVLSRMITQRYLYPNCMLGYWAGNRGFGFDPVGTIPDLFNNAVIYGWDGMVDLLPALPAAWPKGALSGALVRGQITVDRVAWDTTDGTIDLTLTSGRAQEITLSHQRQGRTRVDC